MDWTDLPSLNSLRAFCAVAETGSYSRAAQKLNVTQAAVNQQIKLLEAHLGVQLIARAGRGIILTELGLTLARDLGAGFDAIRKGVDAVTGADACRPVQITTSPAFAVEWLMPRLAAFQRQHPDITLLLNPTSDLVEPRPGGIDLAIRYTDRRRLEKGITPMLVSDMVVIGAPKLVGERSFANPAELLHMPWLQELGINEVAAWFARQSVEFAGPLTISQMPGNLIMQAVRRGDGITYTVRAFFDPEIRSGTMVELFSEPRFGAFYIKTAPGAPRPAVRTVLDWLSQKTETTTA